MNTENKKIRFNSLLPAILIAGSADALAAIIFYTPVITLSNAAKVFGFIASAVFGKQAAAGTGIYPWIGLLMHFFVATVWGLIYYFFSKRFLPGGYVLLKCIAIGALIWIVMNLIVLPVFFGRLFPMSFHSIFKGMGILVVAVGLPFALILGPRRCLPQ
ncbi:MAG TPA: hypothetical protein VG890_08485 [Puia sp.]|nr:hypothetical protein [Puia sp.]